jgi:GT2 family glycosyltransferase
MESAMQNTDSEYVLLVNDDIIMTGITDWAEQIIELMKNHKIGSVSCLTNNAAGWGTVQNFPSNYYRLEYMRVPWLSHFFVMIKKEAIKKVGFLDDELPGGDDIDYCIRMNDAGYWCVLTPKVFCWHHYAQTGKRIFGKYWDSEEHTEKINNAMIKKHGFKKFIYTMSATEMKEE